MFDLKQYIVNSSYNTTENLETMLIRMVLKTSGYILTSANNLSA